MHSSRDPHGARQPSAAVVVGAGLVVVIGAAAVGAAETGVLRGSAVRVRAVARRVTVRSAVGASHGRFPWSMVRNPGLEPGLDGF